MTINDFYFFYSYSYILHSALALKRPLVYVRSASTSLPPTMTHANYDGRLHPSSDARARTDFRSPPPINRTQSITSAMRICACQVRNCFGVFQTHWQAGDARMSFQSPNGKTHQLPTTTLLKKKTHCSYMEKVWLVEERR